MDSQPTHRARDLPNAPAGARESLRLLFAIPFGPRYDNLHGGRVTAQLLRRLTRRHRVAVVYLRRPGHRPIDDDLAVRCELVREVELSPPWLGRAWRHRVNVLAGPIVGLPSSVSAGFSARFLHAVRSVAQEWNPDVIQLEHDALAYCARPLAGRGRVRILVDHDPGLRAAEHMAGVTAGRQRLAHRLDAFEWRRYWRRNLAALDAAVVFTEDDRALLRSVVPDLRVATIPLGIDLPDEPLSPLGTDGSVIFVGGYAHQPNADAALRLAQAIMPRVRRDAGPTKLVLVGDRPTPEMAAAAGSRDEVEITGRVASVEPYVDRAAVVALPIRIGGGMRVKLLEALAAGKAVVASPVAAAGLPLRDREQLILARTDAEFGEAIVALLHDERRREQLGRAARTWAVAHLSWESRVQDYERLYRQLLGGGALELPAAELSRPFPTVERLDQ
jgi:polysaccharide biosynthesis protein PslH